MSQSQRSELFALSQSPGEFTPAQLAEVEKRTLEVGKDLFAQMRGARAHVLQRRWWDDQLMSLAMRDEALKTELFRFVDVLPMLHSSEAVVGHLVEYLHEVKEHLPASLRVALGVARRTPVVRGAVARATKLGAQDLARRFIAGTTAKEVLAVARRKRQEKQAFTLDILGEAVISEVEAKRFYQSYADLLAAIAPTVNAWPEVPQIDNNHAGPIPRVNLSIKLSALDSQFDPIDSAGVLARAGNRLRELLRIARGQKAFINVDMESYEKKDLTLQIFRHVLMEPEFRDTTDVGIVIQCYLRDAEADLAALADWARQRGAPVWVRLVKGAYWDYETTHARAENWPIPVWSEKWQSDACFERLTRFLLQHGEYLRPAFGSHNVRSLAHALAAAEILGLPQEAIEMQMLYGMADEVKAALVKRGYRLRIYMPYGELIPGMAYLVRRLLENTSNDSFIRAGSVENANIEELLKNPMAEKPRPRQEDYMETPKTPQPADALESTFVNHPQVDFSQVVNRLAMQRALEKVKGCLGEFYPLVIGDEEVETKERIVSIDPSQSHRVVGETASASAEHVEQAVASAKEALPAWSALGAEARADYLLAAAQTMRSRLFELAAWEVYECGKPWREATADVAEAIDFCEYYAQGAIELEQPRGADVPGEENRFSFLPRGVTAVISPWNFPLAILTGMTTAALATGNTVIMKPAEQSPVMAALLMQIFRDVEIPPGVLHYLPGEGETAGAALVEHPDVALIAFTGSRNVGLAINAKAAKVSTAGTKQVKKVIAEMGGKNAIIIDDDADLDEAVAGVVSSAFGYQGQKCSACSRAIVLREVYDTFLERLVEAARSLPVGLAEDPATRVGPLIDAAAQKNVLNYIEIGKTEGREVLAVNVGPFADSGFFVGPHIFADVAPHARIAQEEIFGPVLAVIPAEDLEEAFAIANGTDYALTGGFYSRSPAQLDRARREFLVGNLYLNRGCTGALVNRQPFGGFNMSGIGSKAGGSEYLHQFVLPRAVTENTMRRGFAPPE